MNKTPLANLTGRVNVGTTERRLSAIAGGALALFGLTRGTFGGLLTAAAGAALFYRGFTGHCAGYASLGIDRSDQAVHPDDRTSATVYKRRAESAAQKPGDEREQIHDFFQRSSGPLPTPSRDLVDKASADSFPASDPPNFTKTAVGAERT